ncbi:hypothetical protein V6U78_05895 [Marinospirillum sp. MEB164]|uniref:Motility protein n=1 Tax=Marinospirillum alkalitolerans TaxID=3123374 RepID=A0ABW8PX60_9GAMM
MDISAVNPEVLVRSTLAQRDAQVRLEAQVSVVKQAQEVQGDAIMALMGSVPAPEGRSGHTINVSV